MGMLARIAEVTEEKRSDLINPSELFRKALGIRSSGTGVSVSEKGSLRYTAVYSAVRVLSETVASLPLKLFRRIENESFEKEAARDHPLFPTLKREPNSEMSSFQLRETMMAHVLLTGNAYAHVRFLETGQVRDIWPLPPKRVTPRRVQGQLVYDVSVPNRSEQVEDARVEDVRIPGRNVLHIPGLGWDGRKGFSPIQMAREAVGLGLATERFGSKFFGNGSQPGGVLTHPETLDDDTHQRIVQSWEEAHGGLDESHRVALLEEGMEWQQISIAPEESQFLESRKFQVQEIARIFRVPPHLLADLERATFSNVEQQSLDFVIHSLRPWLVRWEQALNTQLLGNAERDRLFFEFSVEGLLRGDTESRFGAYATALNNGWMSINEIRNRENMNPIDGGDRHFVPLNLQTVPETGGSLPDEEDRSELQKTLEKHLQKHDNGKDHDHDHGKKKLTGRTFNEREKRSIESRNGLIESWKPAFRETADRVVRREVRDVSDAIERFVDTRDQNDFLEWAENFYFDDHRDFWEQEMRPMIQGLGSAMAQEAGEEIGFQMDEDELNEFLDGYLGTLAHSEASSSINQLRDLADQAISDGEDFAELVDERTGEWEERRGEKISEIHTHREGNAVTQTVFASGGVESLIWAAQQDPCPFCAALDGTTVGIQEVFVGASDSLFPADAGQAFSPSRDVTHPPLHQGCQCTILPG